MTKYLDALMQEGIFKEQQVASKFTRKQIRDFEIVNKHSKNDFEGMTNYEVCDWIHRLAVDLTEAGYGDIPITCNKL